MIYEKGPWRRRDHDTVIDQNEFADLPSDAILWIFAAFGTWLAFGVAVAIKYLC